MNWNLKFGRWFGIDVQLHFTFLLLLALIGLAHWLPDRSATAALVGMAFFVAVFFCVLLHEFGHALVARRFGIGTRDIILLPIGGVARLERMPDRPVHEFWIALAGPAVNVLVMLGLGAWLLLANAFSSVALSGIAQGGFVERLLYVNGFLVLFNLLPAFPLDGGRVLRALLALRLDYARATRIAGRMGQGMAVLFALVGLWANPLLLLIAVFVWLGAAAEMRSAEIRSKLAGVPVDQAMVTDFRVLTPGTTLGSAAQHLLSGSQAEFPVVRDGDLVGVLDSQRLLAGLRAGGPSQAVAEFMVPAAATAAPEEPLDDVLARLTGDGTRTVVVLSGDRLVGLITMDNVSELIEIRGVLQNWTAERRLPSMPPPLPARLGAARELPV